MTAHTDASRGGPTEQAITVPKNLENLITMAQTNSHRSEDSSLPPSKVDAAPACRLLKPKQVAALLGVSERTLERWRGAADNPGPSYLRLSARAIRYTVEAVDRFVADRIDRQGGGRPGEDGDDRMS